MTTLTSETTFSIIASPEFYVEEAEIYISPENTGTGAMRELHYPGDLLAPLIYPDLPDKWTNFDSLPMTARPIVKTELTLGGAQTMQWKGYLADRPVIEYWLGKDKESRMTLAFLRRLYEYYANPPATPGTYITWWPKDRTDKVYNIMIESVEIAGSDITTFLMYAHVNELVALEVSMRFRIISEVET